MASQLKQRIDALAAHRDARLLAQLTRGIEKESLRVLPRRQPVASVTPGRVGLCAHASAHHDRLLRVAAGVDHRRAHHGARAVSTNSATSTASSIARSTTSCCGLRACRACSDRTTRCRSRSSARRTSGAPRHIYRRGLSARYGRLMQTISGIHYNFSIPDALWSVIAQIQGDARQPRISRRRLLRSDPELPPPLVAADLSVRRIAVVVQIVRQRQSAQSREFRRRVAVRAVRHVVADGRSRLHERRTVEPAHLVQLAARSTRVRCSTR